MRIIKQNNSWTKLHIILFCRKKYKAILLNTKPFTLYFVNFFKNKFPIFIFLLCVNLFIRATCGKYSCAQMQEKDHIYSAMTMQRSLQKLKREIRGMTCQNYNITGILYFIGFNNLFLPTKV